MTEIRTGNAIVRIHNQQDQEKVKEATLKFLKAVQAHKKQKQKTEGSVDNGNFHNVCSVSSAGDSGRSMGRGASTLPQGS